MYLAVVPLQLPFKPPVPPMLAKLSSDVPDGEGWLFEPKWDGFRGLVFKSGDEVYIQSRDEKPLGRYFPELEETLRRELPDRCVLDGEVVIATGDRLDFEALLLRIHPAATRVKMLAEQSPSSYVAWDLLALGDEDLRERPKRSGARGSRRRSKTRSRPCTSRPRRAMRPSRATGSIASRARASTA